MEDLLKALKEINAEKKALEDREATIKKSIEDNLNEEGYKNEFITISYTKASSSTSIDLKLLQEKEPELYEDLLKDYPKTTNKKASYRYTFK